MKTPEEQIAELKQSLAQAKQKKTLRDEFAMVALTGVSTQYIINDERVAAVTAYAIADAMMKERHK